ncbi:TPA: hypothetical protein ACXNIY_002111, partial [Stenotrophomonas maltophilia]
MAPIAAKPMPPRAMRGDVVAMRGEEVGIRKKTGRMGGWKQPDCFQLSHGTSGRTIRCPFMLTATPDPRMAWIYVSTKVDTYQQQHKTQFGQIAG